MHDAGSRSGRQRWKRAVWRKRSPCRCSYATSATSSTRSGSQLRSLPAFHRLCAAGPALPARGGVGVGFGPLAPRDGRRARRRGTARARRAARRGRARRSCSPRRRGAARRRRRRGRAAASRLPRRPCARGSPPTTQSAVRRCFTFCIVRSPSPYSPSSGFATTPSRPAPSKRSNHSRRQRAVGGRRREQHRRLGRSRARVSSRARRSRNGTLAQVVVALGEQVEGDERRRRLLREHRDARRRRMDAQRQQVEVEAVLGGDHDLTVDDARARAGGRAAGRRARGSSA